MLGSNYSVPLAKLVILFSVLLLLGIVLTLPLYRFNVRRFIRTKLFVKIIFWIPIFIVFIGILYLANNARLVIWLILLAISLYEYIRVTRRSKNVRLFAPIIFFICFSVALAHFYIIGLVYKAGFIDLLITICFASVLSDVTAFFMGNYIGRHKLPAGLNKNKSWEGVLGQIIGALIGVILVNAFVVHVSSLYIFLPIGLGAVIGDLSNSYVKRRLDIKDWSNNIPGHGGFLDRLSSVAGSALLTFYFLKIFKIM